MNTAHFHLMLVHVPIVLVPFGAMLLLFGLWRDNSSVRSVAHWLFISSAVIAIIAFQLGEGAEEAVEHLAGVKESNIEAHEESANVALWFTIALGVSSLLCILASKFRLAAVRTLGFIAFGLSILSSGALAYTAQDGGKIRHPEAFVADKNIATIEQGGGGDDDD